ncbi:PH domain-containing protein [Corynebacterium aquatimens]|uniref:PH domain-containing protein n=1 Tax=Corynebacterium TaxID=1716 RepID=UPI001F44463C|nr:MULTISPECIES: PH domain-containing protein [Corynebacterium]QYH20199.1 PH domain-containing protein [Corynebacterium aquatimens]UIZ92545.1 PH domain-containing protein [Corynebacterium sp. CNCTC7651]
MTAQPEYRRVHRISPLLRVWGAALTLVALAVFNFAGPLYAWFLDEQVGWMQVLWAVGGIVLAVLVIFGASQLWWSRTGFRVGPEELEFKRGVLTNQVRTARYDRIQAVDVVEPLAARIFGLAAVRVEVAGGINAAIEIAYLSREEAEALREEILGRIAAKAPEGGLAQELQERETPEHDYLVPPIPMSRSLAAAALQFSTLFTVVSATAPLWTDVSLAAVVPVLVGFIPIIWRTIDQSWRFNATRADGVFQLTYGLANRRRQAVPEHRIHALQLKQPLLWRPFGWWTVSVTTAGYASERSNATGTSKLLPVGTWEQAVAVVDAVGPLTAAQLTDLAAADYVTPRRARWVSPIDWRQQTATVRGGVAVTTFGRLTRRFHMVTVPHIQELTMKQGPLQRALKIADVRFDLVPGPVKMTARDVDEGAARVLVDTLRARELPPLSADPAPVP